MTDIASYFPITNPTIIFFVVLLIILFAPIIMGKLRIPHIIGMVLAGVAVGKYGFNILERDNSFELFGKVGLYYIMFLASLEMDTDGVRRNKGRFGVFGLLTFAIPLIITYVASLTLLHYSQIASLLLGCIMASNTLIAYPIVGRYGLQKKPSVVLSVGSSMIALLLALFVLAAVVEAYKGETTFGFWLWFAGKFVLYSVALALIIPRLTRWFLRSYSDAVMQFIFVLAILFMSATLGESVGIEGIFGAFLSGLILNRYIPHVSPLMNRIEFIGNALFIPYFLIGVGMLINVRMLFQGGNILMVVLIVAGFGKRCRVLGVAHHHSHVHEALGILRILHRDENLLFRQLRVFFVSYLLVAQRDLLAASADMTMTTQVRVAANIANGIRHAFKEFRATDVLIGMHMHKEVSQKFWGAFHQSLFNGLNSQIIMARLNQPLPTIRRIKL